ncbi:MAG: methyltransferase domain-containing protein [Alphaproteobacteria bacterium]|nr:methyltransferase domain-containing protein [Alphaproteobacteria bacterium]
MKVTWVSFAAFGVRDGVTWSEAASARYRVILPARELRRHGIQGRLATMADGTPARAVPDDALAVDAVVFSKVFSADAVDVALRAKVLGARVVFDVCDDHFDHPRFGETQRNLAALADVVVASTEAMASRIREAVRREARVIGDPVEGPRGTPRFRPSPDQPLRLLWFGHPSNLDTLAPHPDFGRPVSLHVITAPGHGAEGLAARFTPWSPEAVWRGLEDCDAVILPSRPDDPRKAVKSANRLLEALWAGRLPVAHPLPSYLPFAGVAAVGDDLGALLTAALADPAETERRLGQGMSMIEAQASPARIGLAWHTLLLELLSGSPLSRERRLNLGCGDKLLPGYVNVDVAASRAGVHPDVLCDLHHLGPFEDDSADEILAVHVVEHFWRWEVVDILKEWLRVLKPGGRMVLECPNLISACQEFLRDPDRLGRADVNGQRAMWVFYGDPSWRDPLMLHRWGYTPATLAEVMAEAGLVNVRREPALFKLREPRDMRIVGEKPI